MWQTESRIRASTVSCELRQVVSWAILTEVEDWGEVTIFFYTKLVRQHLDRMLYFCAATARGVQLGEFGVGPPRQRLEQLPYERSLRELGSFSFRETQLEPSSSYEKVSVMQLVSSQQCMAGGQEVTCLHWNKSDSGGGGNIPPPRDGSCAVEQGPRVLVWPPGLTSWLMLCWVGLENSWEPFYPELLYYPKCLKRKVILIMYFLSPNNYSLLF